MQMVYLSPVPWDSVAQRPHFFVKQAIENGVTSVLWIDPSPSRFPKISDFKRALRRIEANSFKAPNELHRHSIRTLPIEPLGIAYDFVNRNEIRELFGKVKDFCSNSPTVLVSGKPSRIAVKLFDLDIYSLKISDVMDDYPYFYTGLSKESMKKNLLNLISLSDIAIYSSTCLLKKYSEPNRNSLLILNACDSQFVERANHKKKEKVKDSSKGVTFGYVGSVAKWFDWEVVLDLAQTYRESKIRIIGPNYGKIPTDLPGNITLEPAIEHSKVAQVMTDFDYGIIPFVVDELTDSVDPVKYYEYLAAGCKVISTPFGEMRSRLVNGKVLSFCQPIKLDISSEEIVTWKQRFSPLWEKILNKNFE